MARREEDSSEKEIDEEESSTDSFEEDATDLVGEGSVDERVSCAKDYMQYGRPGKVKHALELGIDPNLANTKWGTTLLHLAVEFYGKNPMNWGLLEVLRLLVQKGADPNRQDKKGGSQLH